MPVIVNAADKHPFLPSLGDPAAIEIERALHQDIRPLEIAIINLMADKRATERQLAQWLGNTPLQVNLTFAATDSYIDAVESGHVSKNTPPDHIKKFYKAWRDIKHRKFDGLIVTGVNALKPSVTEEDIWPEVQNILDWSESNVLSSLFLCWGAKAALKHFHDIDSHKAPIKTFGLFQHRLVSDKTGLLFGFPDRFHVPVARWKSPRKADILKHPELEILAETDESGVNMLAETKASDNEQQLYPRRVYILNHPEYDTDTLKLEYERDQSQGLLYPPARDYYTDNDPQKPPINSWRHTAFVYSNWIRIIYEATPYDLTNIAHNFAGGSPRRPAKPQAAS